MVTRTLRAYVELAAGLGEVTRARAVEAAQELVVFAGSEPSPKQVASQVTRLADDLLKAAEHNRDQVVALVHREVESALGRVDAGRLLVEVQSLGTTVAGLAAQVDELARATGMRPAVRPAERADVVEPGLDVAAPAAPRRAAKQTASQRAARQAARTSTAASPTQAVSARPGGTGTSAKKTPAKKTSAKKTSAKKASTTKASPAKKASTKKASAKKASPAKKASAKEASAKKASPAKKASAKKASAKKASATKASTKKASATKASPATKTTGSGGGAA